MGGGAGRVLIAARGLGKAFGAMPVLRGIDLSVASGEVVAILGPNGTGKSTLLKVLAGVMRAAAGSLELFGVDCFPGRSTSNVLARIGYAGHDPLVYRDLSPRQNLEFFAAAYGHDGRREAAGAHAANPRDRADQALTEAGLARVAERPTHSLSRGMLQRLALARATLHGPDVLLLDEPFSALDPEGSARLEASLAAWRDLGRAIVLVVHDLALAGRVASRAVVLAGGRVGAELSPGGPPGALAEAYRRATGETPHVGDRS